MSSVTRFTLLGIMALFILLGVSFALGLRLYVIAPRSGIPDGLTAVVQGARFLAPVDSPEGMCDRWGQRPDTACVTRAITEVNQSGTILLQLPYLAPLAALGGVPAGAR